MAVYNIGLLIKEKRKRLNVSQEDLCGVLIAISTLSKIENGRTTPSKKVGDYLCQKLGIENAFYSCQTSESELKRFQLEIEIFNHIFQFKYDYQNLLDEYKNCSDSMETLEQQFYGYASTLLCGTKDDNKVTYTKREKTLEDALCLTFDKFSFNITLTDYYFSTLEILIINSICLMHYHENKVEALRMMYQLKQYYDTKYVDPTEKAKSYPVLMYNIQNWEGLANNWEAAYNISCEGVEYCVKTGQLSPLNSLLLDKAYNLLKLKRLPEAKKAFLQAYTCYHIMGLDDDINRTLPIVNKELGKEFEIKEEELNR